MAQKSPASNGLSFPYKDLASEVTRRRFIMTIREEMFTKEREEDPGVFSGLDQARFPGMAGPPTPPAPPPSPAEEPEVS